MKKRLLSLMLCTVMLLSLFAGLSVTGYADSTPTPLTFTAEEADSTISFKWYSGSNVTYSVNNASEATYVAGTTITLNKDDTVSFKGSNVTTNKDNHFSMTGKLAASGDVTSLTNRVGGDAELSYQCYYYMFEGCASLVTAPDLPSKILKNSCYRHMFEGCTSLVTAPALEATTLNNYCYAEMFSGCTALKNAPELNANTLYMDCYTRMFKDCTSLTTAPALPAMTLAPECYWQMFEGCTSLTKTPELPATSLKNSCYKWMFCDCTSLTSIPELKATTFGNYSYLEMFKGCTGIKLYEKGLGATWSIPADADTSNASSWNNNMFLGTGGDFKGSPAVGTVYYTQPLETQTLSFESASLEKTVGDSTFTNTLSGAMTDVYYTSSASSVATIDSLTGEVTIVGAGSATITAEAQESSVYKTASASYALTVKVRETYSDTPTVTKPTKLTSTFSDVNDDDWFASAVRWAAEKGVTKGTDSTHFSPRMKLSRGQIVTMLWNLAGKPVVNYAMSFTDVAADSWYTEAIRWAKSEGIVSGYSDTVFGAGDNVTRQQLAVMLYNYAVKQGKGFTGDSMFYFNPIDRNDISSWAMEAMRWCYMNDILTGDDTGHLNPRGNSSRAETVSMLMRFSDAISR